jgi:hypothetical protein
MDVALSDLDQKMLRKVGALKSGHFQVSPTIHTDRLFYPTRFLHHGKKFFLWSVSEDIARHFISHQPEIVIGLKKDVRFLLSIAQKIHGLNPCLNGAKFCPTVHTLDKIAGKFVLTNPKVSIEGKKVLLYESVFLKGERLEELLESIRRKDGIPSGLATLCSRGPVSLSDSGFALPSFSRLHIPAHGFRIAECPQCIDKVPFEILS